MNGPNLFNYATSELSQDAIVSWLAAWADPKYRYVDSALHQIGIQLINRFFSIAGKTLPGTIETIIVKNQHKHIDVLIVVNEKHAIIVEDKIHAQAQGDQLKRYFDLVKKEGFAVEEIIPIYFKTGDQSNYKNEIKDGYFPFLRSDFLSILHQGISDGIKSDVFVNYCNYLQIFDDNVNSFVILSLKEWEHNWLPWTGFFKELRTQLENNNPPCDWGNVNSPGGAFLGLWWNFTYLKKFSVYMQLEWQSLFFKIGNVNDSIIPTSQDRDDWHNQLMRFSAGKLKKPTRFGSGSTMSVAKYIEDYRRTTADGKIDINATVALLRDAEEILEKAIADWKATHPEEVNA